MNKKADTLILGNVITMNERKPFAEAVVIKDEKIIYVGPKAVAEKLCDNDTKVYNYGKNSVYPGFLEAHCHPGGAGYQMMGMAFLDRDTDIDDWVKTIKEYIEAHPNKEVISAIGFQEHDVAPHHKMLDAICDTKPIVATDCSGHCMWLNKVAMDKYGINKEAVKKWGEDQVRVDENGEPTGYIYESAVFNVRAQVKISLNDMIEAMASWQDFALAQGYTGCYDAGLELVSPNEPLAWYQLEKEGKIHFYMYGGSLMKDNTETPEEDMDHVAKEAKEHNSKHFKMLGAKVFCDGIVEGSTAWMIDDYEGKPGYKGVSRFAEHDKMVRLIVAANKHNMNVHVHTIGDRAIRAWIDAFKEAAIKTGNFDQRNAMAHLQCAHPEDIKDIADYNIMAVAGMMWREKDYANYEAGIKTIGLEREDKCYPLKSFFESGAMTMSHSDFPVSPTFGAHIAMCVGALGYEPVHGENMKRLDNEEVSRMDALKALTINVAYSWHEENRMGSLEVGKLANIAVMDSDFLKDDFEKINKAKCLATFVDGELVYKA